MALAPAHPPPHVALRLRLVPRRRHPRLSRPRRLPPDHRQLRVLVVPERGQGEQEAVAFVPV